MEIATCPRPLVFRRPPAGRWYSLMLLAVVVGRLDLEGSEADGFAEADRCYYEQRPLSKPFTGRTISDGWNHDVPKFPAGWLQP